MKAIIRERFGPPEVLQLRDVEKPVPADDQVVVRVQASSVNAADKYDMKGITFLVRIVAARSGGVFRPKNLGIGTDVAGTVESTGSKVTRFKPGDEVYGVSPTAYAEFAPADEARITLKPNSISFAEAAAVPIAGITALQGLRDIGKASPGQQVLINGASGGVGTFAVQIAKWLGAEVTAVCSSGHIETARSLGADHLIDYAQEDFTRNGVRYDLIFDIAGNHSASDYKRALKPQGQYVLVGASKNVFRTLVRLLVFGRLSIRGSRKIRFFVANIKQEDLAIMNGLLQTGTVKPVIERSYPLNNTAEALRYFSEGHAGGKIIITNAMS